MNLSYPTVVFTFIATAAAGFINSADQQPVDLLRFDLRHSRPVIQVSLNGSKPLQFVLDTGASGTWWVDKNTARDVGLTIENRRTLPIGVGNRSVYLAETRGVDVKLGSQLFRNSTMNVVDLSPVESFDGAKLDGIVGAGLLLGYVVEIDYSSSAIRFFPRNNHPVDGLGDAVRLSTSSRLPVATFKVETPGKPSIRIRALIDTGSHQTVVLSREIASRIPLSSAKGVAPATIGIAIGGAVKGYQGQIERLCFSDECLDRVPVVFPQADGMLRDGLFDGIVGGGILKHYCAIFDFSGGRLWLKRNTRPFSPDRNGSGLVLVRPGPTFERTYVESVFPDSPAAVSGIGTGDEITNLGGLDSVNSSLDQMRSRLQHSGGPLLVNVTRDNRKIEFLMRLGGG